MLKKNVYLYIMQYKYQYSCKFGNYLYRSYNIVYTLSLYNSKLNIPYAGTFCPCDIYMYDHILDNLQCITYIVLNN